MCPRENDVSAISRKFAGITRVFLSPPPPPPSHLRLPPPPRTTFLSCYTSLLFLPFFLCFLFFFHFVFPTPPHVHVRARAGSYGRAISRALFASSRERTHFAGRGTRVCFHSCRFARASERTRMHRLSIF